MREFDISFAKVRLKQTGRDHGRVPDIKSSRNSFIYPFDPHTMYNITRRNLKGGI